MACWSNTAKIAIGASIVAAATVAMIVIIFTAASWATPVLWIELISIGIIGLIGLLWIIIIVVQQRSAMIRRRNRIAVQLEAQPNPAQPMHFRPTSAPQLPSTGYSPKLRDDAIKHELVAKDLTPPSSPRAQAGSEARVPTSTSEEESTVSEAADKPYYNKHVEA